MNSLSRLLVTVVCAASITPLAFAVDTSVPSMRDLVGSYYYGDGTGVNCRLELLASGTFSYTLAGCGGIADQNEGKATVNTGVLKLAPAKPNPNQPDGVTGTPTKFCPVRWGRRTYLLEQDKVVDFCNAVNEGREPRKYAQGKFYLGDNQWKKPVRGKPALPAQYQACLLSKPVQGQVTRLTGKGRAQVNLGAKDGVFVHMKLLVFNHDRTKISFVYVESVETDRCRIINDDFGDPLAVGETATSRFPD